PPPWYPLAPFMGLPAERVDPPFTAGRTWGGGLGGGGKGGGGAPHPGPPPPPPPGRPPPGRPRPLPLPPARGGPPPPPARPRETPRSLTASSPVSVIFGQSRRERVCSPASPSSRFSPASVMPEQPDSISSRRLARLLRASSPWSVICGLRTPRSKSPVSPFS